MLEINNVSKILKKKTILENINLSIQKGDFVLLKGHNGCGKTMLLRLMCRLISPDEGEVRSDEALTYGVIIENPTFLLGETAMYNLKYLASINGKIGEKEISEWLKKFGLYEVRNKKVRTFSLGMRQRLAIVQAIMEEPDILLLDEPFNAIDDDNLAVAYEILNEYNRKGHTIIVASHGDYRDKCAFNRIITMNNGRIKEDAFLRNE